MSFASAEAAKAAKETVASRSKNPSPKDVPLHDPISKTGDLLFLQKTIGNQAVNKLFNLAEVDAKLNPESSAPAVGQEAAGREDKSDHQPNPNNLPHDVLEALNSPSEPLDSSVRSVAERLFNHGFSNVRVHNDAQAASSARSLNARAYTVGSDILFDSGQYSPQNAEGSKLIAHELTHVIQQEKGGETPRLSVDASHELEATSASLAFEKGDRINVHRETGKGIARDTKKPGPVPSNLDRLSKILNTAKLGTEAYKEAVDSWPENEQVWKHLTTREARKQFIRYLLSIDPTSCRPVQQGSEKFYPPQGPECKDYPHKDEIFPNWCTSYATQLALNLQDKPSPSASTIEELKKSKIYYQPVKPKFRIPIQIVVSSPHAFNAVLVDDKNPSKLESYVFIEPFTDEVFDATSAKSKQEHRYLGMGVLSMYEPLGPMFQGKLKETFALTGSGQAVKANVTQSERLALFRICGAIFKAEDKVSYDFIMGKGKITYEEYVRKQLAGISDKDLLMGARYIIGREFRRTPGGKTEILTVDAFVKLSNRESIREKIQNASKP